MLLQTILIKPTFRILEWTAQFYDHHITLYYSITYYKQSQVSDYFKEIFNQTILLFNCS